MKLESRLRWENADSSLNGTVGQTRSKLEEKLGGFTEDKRNNRSEENLTKSSRLIKSC